MSEMVERVAASIYRKFEDRPNYAKLQMNGVLAEELARAAIEAMREPTTSGGCQVCGVSKREMWNAMIDEALK